MAGPGALQWGLLRPLLCLALLVAAQIGRASCRERVSSPV